MVTVFSKHKTRPSGPTGMAGTLGKKNQPPLKNGISPCIPLPVVEELVWEGELGKGD